MASEYDVYKILEAMELELTKLYGKTMSKGAATLAAEAWKKEQLRNLKKFKMQSRDIIAHYQKLVEGTAKESVLEMYRSGRIEMHERLAPAGTSRPSITHTNNKRMMMLLNAVHHDISKVCVSAFRRVNDVYRENIFKAAVNYNSGTLTMRQSIDMASQQFLSKGINSITYSNGQEHDICSYSEMAVRTNGTRAQLMGESEQAREYGVNTCYVSEHSITCDACAAYQGQWYIDDVYNDYDSDGKSASYPLLSEAVDNGLFHPNCRHHVIYGDPDGAENKQKERTDEDREKYNNQQQQRKLEREIRKAKRTEAGSVDPAAKAAANKQVKATEKNMREFLKDKPYLIRQKDRETDAVIES